MDFAKICSVMPSKYDRPEQCGSQAQRHEQLCERCGKELGRQAVRTHMSDSLVPRKRTYRPFRSFMRDLFSGTAQSDLLLKGDCIKIATPQDPADIRRSIIDPEARKAAYHYSMVTEESVSVTDSPYLVVQD